MATQLALCFEEVPLTCEVQARYPAIAGCLAGKKTPAQLATIDDHMWTLPLRVGRPGNGGLVVEIRNLLAGNTVGQKENEGEHK